MGKHDKKKSMLIHPVGRSTDTTSEVTFVKVTLLQIFFIIILRPQTQKATK